MPTFLHREEASRYAADNVVRTLTPLIDYFNRYMLASLVRDVSPTVSAAASAKQPWCSRLTELEAAHAAQVQVGPRSSDTHAQVNRLDAFSQGS
jgi:hypothetical protein